jgi:integrase/recombinase XerD
MPHVIYPNDVSDSLLCEFFQKLHTRKRKVGRNIEKVGVKNSTICAYWTKLNSFFEWLTSHKYIEQNPLITRPPEAIYNDNRALTHAEVEKILSAVNIYSRNLLIKKRDTLIVHILFYCGLRKNELVSLKTTDIDIEKRILTVRGETSKSKRTRQIPINHHLQLSIQDYFFERRRLNFKSEFLLVSNNQDKRLTAHGLKYWVKKLNILSGVSFHLHKFRHTFACNLGKCNASSFKIQKLMGHTDLRMTERYLRSMNVDDLREEINQLCIL